MDGQTDERERSVLGRAVGVLDAFAGAEAPELTLTELADRAELPLTTTHRLAGQLVHERLLERLPSGRFRIGPHVQELMSLAPRDTAPDELARPFLQDLADVTGQPVQLVTLDGVESVVVQRVGGDSRQPTRMPLHASCSGLVLLAHAPRRLLDAILAGPLERRSDAAPGTAARVRAVVEIARKQGHLELRGAQPTSTVSVAAPVLVGTATAVAAVSISGAPASARSLVPAVLTTARGIARAMGAPATGAIPIQIR